MSGKIKAILNRSNPAWFCERCKKEHHILYIDGNQRYCERCVPEEVKNTAEYCNEIFEVIATDKK